MEDLNKEIETWEKVKPENVGVYLSDKRDSINIDGYSDAIRSRYAYETNVQQMPKSDYVGMVRFDNDKTKRNPLTSAFRGAWSGLLQLPAGVDNAVTGLSEWITNAIYSGNIEAQKEISEAANALRQKNDAWLKEWSYQKEEKDSSFAFDFGQGGGSMFAAIGLSILTRNPNMAATMFGASQYGNLNKELREKGFDINYGNLTALAGGIAEGGLEKFGLHMWFENYASKKIGAFLIKQGATEFVQESSQQAAEEFIMRVSGGRVDGKSFSDVVSEVLYAGALGGMLGFVGGGVSIPATQAYKGRAQNILERGGMSKDEASRYIEAHLYGNEKQQKELQDKVNDTIKDINVKYATLEFKKLGIEEEQAKEFAENMATNPEEVKASLIDILNKEADFETLQNNSLADDVAYFKEQRKKDMVAEAFDIKEKIKEDAIAAGVSEEEAEVAAALEANFAMRMFEETGETPLDYYENKRALYETENGELIDESELSDEEIAQLEAKEQARAEEEDIPFFQEEVYKEDGKADINSPEFKAWSNNAPFYEANKAEEHKFKTGKPLVAEVFHGTQRADRVGSIFLPSRATSGPMAFSTDTRSAAEGYANTKRDTSIYNETEGDFHKYFKVKIPNYNAVTLDRLWNILPYNKKQEMREKAPHITTDENGENIIYDENEKNGNGGYNAQYHGNNALEALVDAWMMSGSLWGEEEKFKQVMELAGLGEYEIQYVDPNAIYPKVYELYVEMQKPLVSYDVPQKVIDALDKASKKQSRDVAGVGTDFWDKNTRDPIAWMDALKEGDAYVWTSIPDWVTNTLKKMGYDGIVDTGGKGGGTEHNVFIPFESTQYKSVYNKGTFSKENPDIYYQSAFHGSQNKELEGEKFDLKYAGKTTGNVHGYGVYAVVSKPSAEYWAGENGQVYELDVPEDFELIDEQKGFDEQPEKVRYAILGALEKINGFGLLEKAVLDNMPGGEIYVALGKDVFFDKHGYEGGSTEIMKAASEFLDKLGIKGITYDYANEKNFVIFNPADVKVIQKFYQGENNPLGSYMPASRVIHLFKNANRSTLIHELGHHFTMQYVKALEANGRTDKLEGFYNWLGINNISEATTQTWEQMARGFETYVMEGVAPNIDTESLFQKFKKYLIGVYTDLKGKVIKPEEINDDVREFFDIMIAGEEEAPDVMGLEGKLDQIKSAISGALKGEEVNFEGLSTKDLRELVKLMTMRKPRKPKNLKQKIRSVGGIDIDFAKAIGIYDSKKGNEGGFFKKNGEIAKEDSLIEFLVDEGYLASDEAETYEQSADLYDKAIDLIENAEYKYTIEEQQKIDERDAIEALAYEAAKKLGDIKTDDIFKAMKVLKKYDMKAVDKNTLKYLNASIKQVERLAKEAKKELKQDISDKQAQLIDFVKKLPLSYKSQMKIMERLKRAKLADDFEKVINQAAELSKEFYLNEKRKMLSGMIDEQVKSSKPKKVTQQKYDYANNKLFKDLRDYSKMTQDQAAEQLSKAQINDDITPEDLVRMHYLNYKANGAKTSTEMLEQVYADLVIAKQQGEAAKDEADFEKSMNREAVRQEIIEAIDANDADKNTLKTRIGNLYRKGLTNLYSLINSISSKKLADAFEMETVLNRAQIKYHKQTEALKEKAFRVYNVKSAGDLLNKFSDMGKTIGHLYNVDGIKAEEISVMKLVDIYNAMKNEKTRQDYIDNYGEEQLERLLSYLTPQDIAFADLMMEDINSLFPEVNKTYIKIYGMDLLKVENYWPATSEHTTETSLLGDYYSQQTTPSSWKERTKGRVTPVPSNAWTKYLKHINENIYMINTAEKYKELATVFKSKRIRNKIINKFGVGVYNELMKQISSLSLNAKSDSLNYIESAFGSILNNFVVAKIAVAPTVFAGQLTSITNYAENVKSTTFYKHFAEGLTHPKQTIKFMKDVAGDFLEARYKGGYAESISNVLSEAEDAMSQKFRLISPKTKYNTANALSSFVRMGDIGAIIFGGYGQVKANLESGMSMEESIKRFEFDTLRSQQSSIKASLGSFQQSKGIARMFLAFKNTQHQYFRKIADAVINLQRGEISSKEAAKIIGNYALIQTTLYVMAKNLVNAGLGLLDDDDKITDGVLEQILLGTIDAIPFLSDMLHFAYRRISGQYSPNLLSMVGIDDIQRSINKFYKQEKNVYDYVEIITPLIEGTTSLPVQRFERMFKKWTGE